MSNVMHVLLCIHTDSALADTESSGPAVTLDELYHKYMHQAHYMLTANYSIHLINTPHRLSPWYCIAQPQHTSDIVSSSQTTGAATPGGLRCANCT